MIPIYRTIAARVLARQNCFIRDDPLDWFTKHGEYIDALVKRYAPSGSGFDAGTRLDWDATTPERLVFVTSFHHLTEHGYYDGWTEHRVTIRPSLALAYHMTISGRDRNEIKDYIGECFSAFLDSATPADDGSVS